MPCGSARTAKSSRSASLSAGHAAGPISPPPGADGSVSLPAGRLVDRATNAFLRGDELRARIPQALEVIYLVFNEGYAATAGEDWLRQELCEEAMRLGRILAGMMYFGALPNQGIEITTNDGFSIRGGREVEIAPIVLDGPRILKGERQIAESLVRHLRQRLRHHLLADQLCRGGVLARRQEAPDFGERVRIVFVMGQFLRAQ